MKKRYLILLVYIVFLMLPLYWMLNMSLKTTAETLTTFSLVPQNLTFDNYRVIFTNPAWYSGYLNSISYVSLNTVMSLLVALPAAYAFSRFRFPGRRWLMVQFLVVNMFPIVLIIIPLFVLMRSLGLLDTFIGVIAGHSTFAIPFSVWMMTSYMNAIPTELDEAAIMDGASRLQTIRLVILPLVMPGIVTTGIYIFVTSWNEYLFAMMLSGQNVRTVTVALQLFIGEFTVQWGLLTAGGTLVAIPVTILFLLVQRRLVSGLTAGAVKS